MRAARKYCELHCFGNKVVYFSAHRFSLDPVRIATLKILLVCRTSDYHLTVMQVSKNKLSFSETLGLHRIMQLTMVVFFRF